MLDELEPTNKSDFNHKWYIIGTIVGMFAGITIGYLMFG
jgi:hypothetical protein